MQEHKQSENGIEFKLFVGCPINAELRLHLDRSSLWKEAKILQSSEDLIETHFNQKEYIGFFLKQDKPTLSELQEIEMKILQTLKSYCPQFASEKIRILVFSQLFIS